ncbi:MAG: hypothetical protein MR873_01900 [Parabacteroides sp.]|nr:hypothetical protein [Parabacteroides sp.]
MNPNEIYAPNEEQTNASFACIGRGYNAPCLPATPETWLAARTEERLIKFCQNIEQQTDPDTQKRMKGFLPVWTPRCGGFRNGHRSQADAYLPLNRQMFDIDAKGHTDEILTVLTDYSGDDPTYQGEKFIGPFLVLQVEESVRRGTHVLVVPPADMDLTEAQGRFSELIGLPVDPAVKNVAGCIFMVPEDHVRYQSRLFFKANIPSPPNQHGSVAHNEIRTVVRTGNRSVSTAPRPVHSETRPVSTENGLAGNNNGHSINNGSAGNNRSAPQETGNVSAQGDQLKTDGMGKAEEMDAADGEQGDGLDADEVSPPNDHVPIKNGSPDSNGSSTSNKDPASDPPADASHSDSNESSTSNNRDPANDPAADEKEPRGDESESSSPIYPSEYEGIPYKLLVEALSEQLGGIPEHGSRNNFIFSMACHLRYVCNDDPKWIREVLPTFGEQADRAYHTIQSACNRSQSRNMPHAMKRALRMAKQRANALQALSGSDEGKVNPYLLPTPPSLPKRLPKLVALLVSKVDPMYQPAVAQAIFPPLGAHLHGVQTRYIDNSLNDLGGFMAICMATQSIGKGAVNMPIEMIMEDIRRQDEVNRDREREWKSDCKRAKSNEKKPPRPEGLYIQYLMSNMTNAALVQRLIDVDQAGGRFIYVKMDEIELLDQIKATGGATASELIRLAFTQSLYGQERVGNESVTGTPPLRFNFNASTTIQAGKYYFRNGLVNGTLSRLSFSTICKPEGRRVMPRFGNYDEAFSQRLQPFIEQLKQAKGLVQCPQAERMAEKLVEENADLSELSGDEAFETLSYRAMRMAYDKAMLLYISQGCQWTNDIARFCHWSMQYDLWCKLHFFGEEMREQMDKEKQTHTTTPGPRNLLNLLPDRFSAEDLQEIHRAQGRKGNVKQLIYTWTCRGYIERDEQDQAYVKTNKYLNRHANV